MPGTSLAAITSGLTMDEAKRQRDEAAAYLSQVQQAGASGMPLQTALGYVAFCDLKIEFIEEQLA